MDLKIKDVAELLSVSETTIRRWLLEHKIPAYKLNRQYRFSRIEIENWMMRQKLGAHPVATHDQPVKEEQIFPVKQEGNQQFSLYRAINRGGVFTDIPGKTKKELIQNTMIPVAQTLRLDPTVLSELLLDRETLMPTAFNHGVAVPHSREIIQQLPFDLLAVVFPKQGIDWGALDEQPVHTLFFLFATGDKIHLRLLAKIAHFTSDKEAHAFLQTKPDKGTLLEFIRQWESRFNG